MPHADSALVPESITSKSDFWAHVYSQLDALLDGQHGNWVTNLSNAASLIYNSLLAFHSHFGDGERAVNWCGFYLDSPLFPSPQRGGTESRPSSQLLLGPFNGRPACQYINTTPGKSRGVCADAFLQQQTVLVDDVESYPGHIACDGATRSEIVCPLILPGPSAGRVLGVLDLDCLAPAGFDADDKLGLEKIAELLVNSCNW
ncbi:GAF domain-containing protein [Mycena indigotica]|uniref:GAF domain-containing protein n=1 Tax=Mycena indigotica TaxID=2126181 RepID=A0A8H6TEN3_9AGAR|nr:GAF domain-containing protein [Mycena indigotica]KAF7315859.1 GAF domain-containing protein [Mycena indigotica]